MISIDDYRWSALARYHDAAMESAMLLLALSRCPSYGRDTLLRDLDNVRSHVRMMNEMLLFSIHARKAIEIASLINPKIDEAARGEKLPSAGVIYPDPIRGPMKMTELTVWKILSKIIHSVSVVVYDADQSVSINGGPPDVASVKKFFAFASDKDEPSAQPGGYVVKTESGDLIVIEELMGAYAGLLAPLIEAAYRSLRGIEGQR